ncbi:MAG: hypothetical protein HFI32_02220 [Lachnospiraceae bacterium]|nr:hypothetical protein [Lachnospiraceae bacterium]
MRITVNDLAFEFPLYEKAKTMEAVYTFTSVCKELESASCHNVERLMRTEIDKGKELYPTGNLYRIIQDISDRDDRKYFLGLLINRELVEMPADKPFIYKNRQSFVCAAAKEDAVVSLRTDQGFKQAEIVGEIGQKEVRIKNISSKEHIRYYGNMLGIRTYEANSEKHKKDRENPYGKGKIGSPMDLSDEEAQKLLDHAIWIKQRLYARKGNHNYAFQKTRDCIYHGYIADDLDDDILSELYARRWD